MDAVSLHVLSRVSSQMAPIRLSASRVPSLYGQFHFQACFWSQVLGFWRQARLHSTVLLIGRLRIHGGCVYKEESLGLASNKYHTDKLRQVSEGERQLLTSFQGEHLLVFLSGAGREIRENIYPAPSSLPAKGLDGSFEFTLCSHLPQFLLNAS